MKFLIATTLLPLIVASPLLNVLEGDNTQPPYIDVPLVTFDGKDSTTFKFHELNDPVMVSSLLSLKSGYCQVFD